MSQEEGEEWWVLIWRKRLSTRLLVGHTPHTAALKQICFSSRTNTLRASKLAMWPVAIDYCFAANIQWLRTYT